MTTLNWPSIIAPSSAAFRLITNTLTFTSPLDRTTQTIELTGARWAGVLTWNTLNEARWRLMTAFIVELGGPAGRFIFTPPQARLPTGAISGSPTINGAGQTGTTLNIANAGVSVSNVFKRGDYVSFDTPAGREMKMVTADASSNGSGQVALAIRPPIRSSPSNGAALVYSSPSTVFMLTDDAQGVFEYRPSSLASLTLEIIEAI